MTDKGTTEIIVIVDRSASMSAVADEAINGFNEFLKEQQESKVGKCLMTYTQFNTNYEIVHRGVPIENMKPLSRKTFSPEGFTALLDAVGRTLDETGDRLSRMDEAARPGKVVVVIITDGEENSSREYTHEAIQGKVKHQADVYDWSFVFIGQNIDAFSAGQEIGINMNHANMFVGNASSGGAGQRQAYAVASAAILGTRGKVVRGVSSSFSYAEKDVYTSALDGDDDALRSADDDVKIGSTNGSGA